MNIRESARQHAPILLVLLFLAIVVLIAPSLFIMYAKNQQRNAGPSFETAFPVTVDTRTKTITENALVDAYLESDASPLQASVFAAFAKLGDLFSQAAISFSNLAAQSNLALVTQDRIIRIYPGQRKEEVADSFARTLAWDAQEKKDFLTMPEGFLFPATYVVPKDATPQSAAHLIAAKFDQHVLSRYGATTAEAVPLETALTVASLIQKESIGTRDMRLISGIIWNRLFADQKLQLDATLQYVKASKTANKKWWPRVLPDDKFIKSPYNTYENKGLPPTPIANPSVAAIVAALNPVKADCYYYFHDDAGNMHCSQTYEEHVNLLKKIYGRGK